MTVIDQIPVSQNADIKIELLGKTAPTKRDIDDKRGLLAWEMKLEPDEERSSSSAIASPGRPPNASFIVIEREPGRPCGDGARPRA